MSFRIQKGNFLIFFIIILKSFSVRVTDYRSWKYFIFKIFSVTILRDYEIIVSKKVYQNKRILKIKNINIVIRNEISLLKGGCSPIVLPNLMCMFRFE